MTLLVSISGIDGSGKSFFARRLKEALEERNRNVCLLHIDDDRRAVDWQQAGREEVDIYYREYFNLECTESKIQAALSAGEHDVVLLEGIFVHRLPCNAQAWKIYLEVPFETAQARIEARDILKGRSLEEVRHRISQRYFPAQRRYIETYQPSTAADLLIDNRDYAQPRSLTQEPTSWPEALRGSLLALLPSP